MLKNLLTTSPWLLSDSISLDPDWDRWVVHESLRRTISLVAIIHQLLGITRTLDPGYFEPLLPMDVLEAMVLPCSDALWLADDEEKWHEARRRLGSDVVERPLSVGDAVCKLDGGGDNGVCDGGAGVGHGSDFVNDGRGWFARLPELTRLLVSVLSMRV